jgi:hypothetical protein
MTIKELLTDRIVLQCTVDNCTHFSTTESSASKHFTQIHNINGHVNWRAPTRKVWLRTNAFNENHCSPQITYEPSSNSLNQTQIFPRENRYRHQEGILPPLTEPEAQAESERRQYLDEKQTNLRKICIRKRYALPENIQAGVNIPPLTQNDKKKLKTQLYSLFINDINTTLERMMPTPEDEDS